jgi:hypothetical protein
MFICSTAETISNVGLFGYLVFQGSVSNNVILLTFLVYHKTKTWLMSGYGFNPKNYWSNFTLSLCFLLYPIELIS